MSLSAPSGSPSNLKVTHTSPTKATLSWIPVPTKQQNGDITGYTVQVVGPNSRPITKEVKAGINNYEISKLNPFTLYTFKINAKTKAGDGPQASISFKTPEGGETYI